MTKEEIAKWEDITQLPIYNPTEFFMGQIDCRDGNKEKKGMGEDYRRGFAAQFQLESLRDKGYLR